MHSKSQETRKGQTDAQAESQKANTKRAESKNKTTQISCAAAPLYALLTATRRSVTCVVCVVWLISCVPSRSLSPHVTGFFVASSEVSLGALFAISNGFLCMFRTCHMIIVIALAARWPSDCLDLDMN